MIENRRVAGGWNFKRCCASNCKRPQPGQPVGKVAKAFSKKTPGWFRGELVRPDTHRAGTANSPCEPGRNHDFVEVALVKQCLDVEFGFVEAGSAGAVPIATDETAADFRRSL